MTSLNACKMKAYCSRKNRCQRRSISYNCLEDFKVK